MEDELLSGIIELITKSIISFSTNADKIIFTTIPSYRSIFILLLSFGIWTSCIDSNKKNIQKENTEKIEKELQEQEIEIEKQYIAHLESKYNARYFPPESISGSTFTYEIQNLFRKHRRDNFIIKAFLVDIYIINDIPYIEFSCPVDDSYFWSEKKVYFRLESTKDNFSKFYNLFSKHGIDDSFQLLGDPNYLIVAQIDWSERSNMYEIIGTGYGEEVDIELYKERDVIAYGELLLADYIDEDVY